MSWIKDMITTAVDGLKKDAQYEARKVGRRAMGSQISKWKKQVASKAKTRIDTYLEKHPSRQKAQEQDKLQVEKVAKKVIKDMEKDPKAAIATTPAPVVAPTIDTMTRQIEFDD